MEVQASEFDVGVWTRQVTTESAVAQDWFDRGLNWLYGYNHEEAIACFRRAIDADPACAMAWFGIAYASGPFYNRAWVRFSDGEVVDVIRRCHEAAQQALATARGVSPEERALIEAIQLRYQNPTETDRSVLHGWHWEFTEAMHRAHLAHPGDWDIAALYAEAAITCTPRQLWDLSTGAPQDGSLTEQVLPVLESAQAATAAAGVTHPGVNHVLIHALEMSPFPEWAMDAADGLRGLAPDAGHLEHMPAHIDVLVGEYGLAVEQSRKAVAADNRYLAYAGSSQFYTTACCHDLHLLMYSAMFLGQFGTAIEAADGLEALAQPELIASSTPFMASILDGYAAMRVHVLVRFGRWEELIAMDPPQDRPLRPIGTAMHLYGAAVAHAALGDVAAAEDARRLFGEAAADIDEEAIFLSNPVRTVLRIGEAMVDGEIEYRRGNVDLAFDLLREAVARDDALNYTEPWAWMHPPRHALGALLAEQGRYDEAMVVFEEDLGLRSRVARCSQHPNNVWALQGLLECVEATAAEGVDELRAQVELAKSQTDLVINAACFCRTDA